MARIYFADKGTTRAQKCANLWPVKIKNFINTPEEFFAQPGMVVLINPKLIDKRYFIAEMSVYDCAYVEYCDSYDKTRRIFKKGCVMHATYSSGLHIHTSLTKQEMDIDRLRETKFTTIHAGIEALKQAVETYLTYFPNYA